MDDEFMERRVRELRDLIASSVKEPTFCTHLLSEGVITDKDATRVREMMQNDTYKANLELMDCVFRSEMPGKWKSFLDVLQMPDFENIRLSLMSPSDSDDKCTQHILSVIQKYTKDLAKGMNSLSPIIVPILVDKNVLNAVDKDNINSQLTNKGDYEANLMTIERMKCRATPRKWYRVFLQTLVEVGYTHLVEQMEPKFISDHDFLETFEFGSDGPENEDESSDDNSMASDCEETQQDPSNDISTYELRSYQIELAQDAINGKNTIICSETGTGKTWVALEIIKKHFEAATKLKRKVAFMARTSILVKQQADRFKRYLPMLKTKLLTGEDEDSKQLNIYMDMNDIICFTPQILVNNLDIKAVGSLSELSLLILDECHHTRGDEPYTRLMRKYLVEKSEKVHGLPQIIGLTASIGVGKSRTEDEAVDYILRVMACLDVRILSTVEKNIAALRQHTNMPVEETIPLEKPDFDPCKDILLVAIEETEDILVEHGVMQHDMIDLIAEIRSREKESQAYNKLTVDLFKRAQLKVDDYGISRDICACARYLNTYNSALEINKLLRAKDVIKYLAEKRSPDGEHKDKHTEMEKTLYQKLLDVQKKLLNKVRDTENPNVRTLSDTLKNMLDGKGEDSRALVFVKARATCRSLAEFLADDLHRSGYKTSPLYGKDNRGGDDGMTESVQTDILEKFREGIYKVLVCTSVGNEGIDVPQCNIVLSYEYSGDEITKIQMKGRARQKDATVTLIADEKILEKDRINAYKAAMMYRALKKIKYLEPKYVETKVRQFQVEEMSKHLFKVETEFYKNGRKSDEDHDILCGRCNVFACYVSDVRQMGSNRVVIDKTFADKVERKEHRRPKRYDGLHKKFKMFCKQCGLDWGIIGKCKGLDCFVLKIANMKFRNRRTQGIQVHEKWQDQPYRVPEMTPEDVPRLLGDQ